MFRIVAITAIILTISVAAMAEDDFGIWTNVTVNKTLSSKWAVEAGTEYRTKENSGQMDQWQLEATGIYTVCKYLKLSADYEFHLKNRKSLDGGTENITRHRFMFGVTPQTTVGGWLKLSLRERYQYTGIPEQNGIGASNDHHLRSRFKAEVSKKNLRWAPYTSCELFNYFNENFKLDEIRITAGTGYKINSHHTVSLGYLLKMDNDGNDHFSKRRHVVQMGYTYRW